MKKTTWLWLFLGLTILVTDIIIVIKLGSAYTLSVFLYNHQDFIFIPFTLSFLLGHFFGKPYKIINDNITRNIKTIIAFSIMAVVLGISFLYLNINVSITLLFGYFTGRVFWSVAK